MAAAVPRPAGRTAAPLDWISTAVGGNRALASLLVIFRLGLDLLVITYLVGLSLVALIGGVDLGVVRVHDAAKPLLVLLVVVPMRIALGGRSWLADVAHMVARAMTGGWELARARVPAAVADTLFACVVVTIASVPAGFLANLVLDPARERGFTLPFRYEKFAEVLPPGILAGTGKSSPDAAGWLERLSHPPLAGHVRHLGYVPAANREDIYAGARLLVMPSRDEGFGIPVLEAMSAGVPVVAANRGALPEVLGDAGVLVDPDDVNALAEAIHRMPTDEAFATGCAERGLARAQEFSWERAAIALHGAYEAALENRRRRRGAARTSAR